MSYGTTCIHTRMICLEMRSPWLGRRKIYLIILLFSIRRLESNRLNFTQLGKAMQGEGRERFEVVLTLFFLARIQVRSESVRPASMYILLSVFILLRACQSFYSTSQSCPVQSSRLEDENLIFDVLSVLEWMSERTGKREISTTFLLKYSTRSN